MNTASDPLERLVLAAGEEPIFSVGQRVRVLSRSPMGHYRVPQYIRGRAGIIDAVVEPMSLNNEEEGFGRNAGDKRHYYRLHVPMLDIWPEYPGSARDQLCIEVFETWLEGAPE